MAYPPPQSGAPTSYKTNVNRAKTKRWVEAKSYSYDGDDWGDADDYDDYEDPPAPPASKPTGLRQRGQSATNPTQVQNEIYQGPSSQAGRHGFDNTVGNNHTQNPHGARSVTNPQLEHQSILARSNSFDRGDERRAFSGPGPLQNLSSPIEPARQSNSSQRVLPQTLAHQDSSRRAAVQKNPGPPGPGQQQPYGSLPNQEGLTLSSSSPSMFAGKGLVQSPIDSQAKMRVSVQPEAGHQQAGLQSHLDSNQQPPRSQQTYLPTDNYGTDSRPEQAPQLSFDKRTYSVDSNEDLSHDFETRHDLSQLGPQRQLQTTGSPSPQQFSESTSSSSFPPRKSSLTQGLPNLPHAPPAATLAPSGGESHPAKDRTGNTDLGKPPMIVRPAEIYKRMQEEQERSKQSQDLTTPSINSNTRKTIDGSIPSIYSSDSVSPNSGMIEERAFASGASRVLPKTLEPSTSQHTAPKNHDGVEVRPVNNQRPYKDQLHTPAGLDTTLRPVLPDVTRMSSFGDLFTTTSSSDKEEYSTPPPQEPTDVSSHATPLGPSHHTARKDLQHQQSIGLRSVVHQAFDTTEDQIPATPSSMAGSAIARSTSGGTSVISPIISRGPSISRAIPNLEKEGRRPSDPQVESDESPVDKSTPISSGRNTNPKQISRNVSPSQPSDPTIGDLPPPNLKPGHRRDTSTPSPNNSPARTPALESSKLVRPLEEAELAVVTPTEPAPFEHSDSQIWNSASRNESNINAARSGDTATERQPVDWKPLDVEARLPRPYVPSVTDTSIKQQGGSIPGSPVTPLKGPLSSRPESPSKNRVRDLAGKFESNSNSRRGSDHSISQSNALLSSPGQKADDVSPTRPVVDRLESFRPRLPGAWESFSSNAPKRASVGQLEKGSASQEQVITPPMLQHPTEASLSPESVPHEPQSNTAKENKDISPVVKAVQATQDSFAAAAAAGVALAGALTAAVGINQEGSRVEPVDRAPSNDNEAKYSTEVTEDMDRNRNFSVDTVLHPEASRPPRPHSAEGDISSEPPTPPSKDLPDATDHVENESKERLPVDPVVESGESNVPVYESNWNHRNQGMLPPLSTDTRKHQYESDKLRREIVKNLSSQGASEPTTAEPESPWQDNSRLSADSDVQAYGRDSMVIPKEYESYWNGSNSGGDLSRSTSDISRLQSASTFSQAHHTQITPPKPLQLGRATQPGNDSTQEHTSDASQQLPVGDHQYSGVKEPLETPLPAPQLKDRQTNDTSLHVPENAQSVSELPDSLHTQDHNHHPLDENRTVSSRATLPGSDHISYRTRAETEDLPQSFSDMPEPNTGLNESGYSPGSSWVQEQPLPNVPLSNPSHVGPQPSGGYATGISHTENVNPTPSDHRAQPEILSEFARTPVSADNNYDLPSPPLPPSAQPKIRAFREIMALKSPEERIQAYEEARDQIAHQNTGLAHWLAVKSREMPEHADVLSGSQRPLADDIGHKSSPSRSKLSGLRPAGAQPTPQPYYQQYLGASQQNISPEAAGVSTASGIGGSQGFSPGGTGSKTAGHNVQTKTKDFLHSAGLFGAKGLFSKGKSKLRGSGGVDKVSSSIPSSDVISRGMQPQNEPPTGPHSQIDSIQHVPKEPLISDRSPPDPPNSVQDLDLGEAEKPAQSQYLTGLAQNDTPITQGHINDPEKSLPRVSRTPTSSSIETRGHLRSQFSADIIHRDALKHNESIASSHSTVSSTTPTEAPDSNIKRPAAYFDALVPEAFNRVGAYESASNSLPLDQHAHSQQRLVLDAPRLPYPDVGGLLHGAWDDQRESGVSQMTKSRYSQPEPISTESNQRSRDSNSIFQAGTNLEQSQRTSGRGIDRERSHQSRSRQSKLITEKQSTDQSSLPTAEPFFLTEKRAQSPQRRPFSFVELSPNKTQKPVQEVLQHMRGDEANPSGNQYDRNPSPVSPQRSMHDLRDQSVPAQDHTSDDFLLSEKQLELATQSGSYHLQDPNLHEHPAFRHEPPSVDNSSLRTDYLSAETPRHVSSKQHERLPPAVPPHGAITKSWRDQSESPFFPTLSAATKAEETALVAKPGDKTSSPETSGSQTKRKRASLFRSLNGRSGKDRDRGRDNPGIIASPVPTHTQQKINSNYHETAQVDPSMSETSKARNKLQRASTSAVAEQDSGKKRRFSALGSLFGRSNQDKTRPKNQVVHSNPPVQSPASVDQPKPLHSRDVHSVSMHQQQQDYYFAPQDYYAQSVQGEYYAPGQQFDHTPSRMIQPTRQAYPRAPESPAYVQDTALRQGNTVHPHYMSNAGEKSSTTTTTPPPASRQSLPRGNSSDSRYSSVPASGNHAIQDSSLVNNRRTLRPENSPRQTGQSGSASQLRSGFPLGTRHQKPQPLQRPQHHPNYSLHETHLSPQYSPTPPPKDDWPSEPQRPSLTPSPSPHSNFQQPIPSPLFPLPPIHSNATTSPSGEKTPREKAEMRKSRQMEIEHGISRAESNAGKGTSAFTRAGRSDPTQRNEGASEKELVKMEGNMRDKRDSTDSVVVMSSTSYPGMEWQPREFSRWDGN